jgi:fermentation-respiration switch protein FrsA (DUF1100 family)
MLFEERLIYFPAKGAEVTPEALGLAHEEVFLEAADGTRIHGWFLPARGSRFTVLLCHGNAGNITRRLERDLAIGVDVFLFDYRGFGRSEGSPDEEGTYRDAVAAHRYLVQKRAVDPKQLILLGESLGAAVAVELSLREPAAALVLEAPFTSIPAMARLVYPFLPFTSRLRTRYDNLAKIPRIGRPLLIIHGRRDVTVPFEHGEELFRAALEPKAFVPLDGAGHADGFVVGGDRYWNAWATLIRSLDSGAGKG